MRSFTAYWCLANGSLQVQLKKGQRAIPYRHTVLFHYFDLASILLFYAADPIGESEAIVVGEDLVNP